MQEGDSAPASPRAAGLLERAPQLRVIASLLDAAIAGDGGVGAIVGGPGEGKSSLLAAAETAARSAGVEVWRARGSHLERDFAFGCVRQLLEPATSRLDTRARRRLLSGAARLAASALDLRLGEQEPAPTRASSGSVLHGLYWLLAGLVEHRGPVLLLIDDAHWVDRVSLEWLAYLRGRLQGLHALALVASRPRQPDGELGPLTALLADPSVTRIGVGPLREESVLTLLGEASIPRADPALAAACHRATAGNPFAVRELATELARRGLELDPDDVLRLSGSAPEAVRRNVQARLARLPRAAVSAAQALAVLGDRATLGDLAALSGLGVTKAAAAVEALGEECLIDELPAPALRFAHPLLRAAVEDSMPPRRKAAMHRDAADLLDERGSSAEAVAAHLLRSDPLGDPRSVSCLRSAARIAMRNGDASVAARCLQRALAEPPAAEQRAETLAELGMAELLLREPEAEKRLRESIAIEPDLGRRASLRITLSEALLFAGAWDPALELLQAGAAEAAEAGAEDLALRAQGKMLALRTLDARGGGAAPAEIADLLAAAEREDLPGARPLRLNVALLLAVRGEHPGQVASLIERGLDDGRFVREEGSDAMEAANAAFALVLIERLDGALELTTEMLADAASRGSVLGFLAGSTFRTLAYLRRGALAEAEAHSVDSLVHAQEQDLLFAIPFTASYLALTLQHLGREREALEMLEGVSLPGPLSGTPAGLTLLEARGRLRRVCGSRPDAVADLRACGEGCAALRVVNPNVFAWRSELALCLPDEASGEAQSLVAEEVALARAARSPRALGVSLLAQAELGPRSRREATLTKAVGSLRSVDAPLELARALIDLGAHRRREGSRTAGRQALKEGLDLAHRCGATPLQRRAREELLAAGARPRRPWLTGVAALTASELRVARLAAEGHRNREIAQLLFVTTPTVKGHLSAAYRKLGLSSRRQLSAALAAETRRPAQ